MNKVENPKSILESVWINVCKYRFEIMLAILLFFSAIIRYSGYNWDGLMTLHPDERSIANAGFNIVFSQFKLDPDFFAYGTLPIYMTKILSNLLSLINPVWNSYSYYILSGRLISATAGIFSILFVYLIGIKLFTKPIGILSAIFLSLTVSQIQYSHFATVDVLLTSFILLSIYFLIDIYYYKATLKTYIILAVIMGLTLAVKVSALPLFFVFCICHIKFTVKKFKVLQSKSKITNKIELNNLIIFSLVYPLMLLLICFIVNFIAQPYVYIRFVDFLQRIHSELELAKHASTCYTQQYVGTPFLIYYLKELILRCMGIPLGILSLISFVIAIVYSLIHPLKSRHIVLLLWALPYFIIINTYETKFLRYLQPMFPFLCIFASYYLLKLYYILKVSPIKRIISWILLVIVIGYSLLYSLAFFSIYMKPHTFLVASKWFYKNVPINSFILSQHWDEGFPINIDHENPKEYQKEDLELYEHFGSAIEDSVKSEYLAKFLEKGDYIVFQTRRLYGGIGQVKDKYPITYRYFDLLFTNRLGFQLIKEFNSYPSLLGITVNDDLADESFSVYDHPKILIFKKVKHLTKNDYRKLLESNEEATLSKNDMLSIHKPDANDFYIPTLIDEILLTSIWIFMFELLSVIGLSIMDYFNKKGAAANFFYYHIAGLLGFSLLLFFNGFLNYSFITVLILFILIITCSIVYIYLNRAEIMQLLQNNLSTFLMTKMLFIGIIIIFILIRAYVPEIYSGEKPMDYGFFNNMVISNQLPAKEIWFGGKDLQYYYFGYFMFSNIVKLTFIPTYIAYNLSVATVGSLTFLAASGVLFALIRNNYWALSGGFFTSILGNLSAIRELVWNKTPLNYNFYWATSRVIPNTINEYPLWSTLFGDLHAQFCSMPIFITIIYFALTLFNAIYEEGYCPINLAVIIGILIGIIAQTNSWDFPSSVLIVFLVIILACFSNLNSIQRINISKNLVALGLFFVSSFIMLPWNLLLSNKTQTIGMGFINQDEAIINLDYITIWGLFLFIITAMFILEIMMYLKFIVNRTKNNYKFIIYSIPILIALIIYVSYLYSTVLFIITLIILAIIALIVTKNHKNKLIYLFIIAGLSINFFACTFYISDHMNTVFKFFLESWYLFAITSAFCIYYLITFKPPKEWEKGYYNIYKAIFVALLAVLVSLAVLTTFTSSYAFMKTDRVYCPKPTINGEKYLQYKRPNEFLAINWIRKNIANDSIIIEGTGEGYSESTRIVMNTGISTVLGWKYHLSQRAIPSDLTDKVEKEIKTIYSTNDVSVAYDLLKKYKVNYVYIGWLEAEIYNKLGFIKFDKNKDKFSLVYSNPDVQIYKVL